MEIIREIYQFLFVSSILYQIYIFGDLVIKVYGRFKLGKETRFILDIKEKILLWVSMAIFFAYLF